MNIRINYNEDTDCFEAWRWDTADRKKLWECEFASEICEMIETDLDQLKIDTLEGSDV